MAQMGKYCRAYTLARLREFGGWSERAENARPAEDERDEAAGPPRTLNDEDILYLQENFTVTDGVFLDEHVIFDDVTPEWVSFCEERLGFEVPLYQRGDRPEAR